jgi:hypothetical protein
MGNNITVQTVYSVCFTPTSRLPKQHSFFQIITHMFVYAGLPEALGEEALHEEVAAVRSLNRTEVPMAQAPRSAEDYGTRPSQLSDADIEALRGRFPILADLSTGFIWGLSATELLSLERASFKQQESEKFKDAEDKLASNRVNLGLHSTEVKAGLDDRWARLHEARFLAGAGKRRR